MEGSVNGTSADLCVERSGQVVCGNPLELCEDCTKWSGTIYIDGIPLAIGEVAPWPGHAMVVHARVALYAAVASSASGVVGFGSAGIYVTNASTNGGTLHIESPQVHGFNVSCSSGRCFLVNALGKAVELLPTVAAPRNPASASSSNEIVEIVALDPSGAPRAWSKCVLKQIGRGVHAGICRAPILLVDVVFGQVGNPAYPPGIKKVVQLTPIAIAPQDVAALRLEPVAIATLIDLSNNPPKLVGVAINLGKAEAVTNASTPTTITQKFVIPLSSNSNNIEAIWIETLNNTPIYTLTALEATSPPQIAPPAPPETPSPPPTPQVVIAEEPMPNTTNPIPTTITIKIRYPGLPLIINQFKVYYEIYTSELGYPERVKSGYLQLNLIPHTDEAIATLSLSGDRKYNAYISILFNGGEIESAIVRNYQLKLASG